MLRGLEDLSLYFKGVVVAPFAANVPENWFFGISPEGIGTLGALLNFAVALGVSALTKPPPAAVRRVSPFSSFLGAHLLHRVANRPP